MKQTCRSLGIVAHTLHRELYPCYTKGVKHTRPMSQLQTKFLKSIGVLNDAVLRTMELDYSQPKLYKKVRKFYTEQGISFTGDEVTDYQTVLDCLTEDLAQEVA